jgi:hypothetical protein
MWGFNGGGDTWSDLSGNGEELKISSSSKVTLLSGQFKTKGEKRMRKLNK